MYRLKIVSTMFFSIMFMLSVLLITQSVSQTERETFTLDGALHKTYSLPDGGSFIIDNHNGKIEIESWDKQEVDIDVIERRGSTDDKIEIEITVSHNRIRIHTIQPDQDRWFWRVNWRSPSADDTIKVPKNVEIETKSHNGRIDIANINGDVEVNSHNGEIRILSITGDLYVSGHNGGVEIDRLDGSLTIKTHNGDIELDRINGDIHAKAHNSTIRMRDVVSRDIYTETHNGRITCDFDLDETGRYEFKSHDGRLDIGIPENSKADVDIRSRRRNFQTDFDVIDYERDRDRRSRWSDRYDRRDRSLNIRGKINGGDARLSLTTYNGGIRLRAK